MKGLNMNIIKAANLVFDYIRRDEEDKVEEVNRAIDHVDVEIEKGSFVAVLGHNGSGKSTFAKHINGILIPTEGTVWVSEMDTADDDLLWEVRKTAGMVFQNPDNQIIGNVVEDSPFSRLSRLTWRSLPFTIIIPCSVSRRISFRSKDRTSSTPVTRLVFLLLTTSLCAFRTCASSVTLIILLLIIIFSQPLFRCQPVCFFQRASEIYYESAPAFIPFLN